MINIKKEITAVEVATINAQQNYHMQPLFVEEIIARVTETLKDSVTVAELIVLRPDYTQIVGKGGNYFRTSITTKHEHVFPNDTPIVHISNVSYNGGDTKVIGFTTVAGGKMHTWNYQPPLRLIMKDHLVSNIGYRSDDLIVTDIVTYLTTGKLPQ